MNWGKNISGSGDGKCKGPEAGESIQSWKSPQELSEAGAEWLRGRGGQGPCCTRHSGHGKESGSHSKGNGKPDPQAVLVCRAIQKCSKLMLGEQLPANEGQELVGKSPIFQPHSADPKKAFKQKPLAAETYGERLARMLGVSSLPVLVWLTLKG